MKHKTTAMRRFWFTYMGALVGFVAHATSSVAADTKTAPNASARCLEDGGGYFRARISGSVNAEINWPNAGLECEGGSRPDGGARVRFSHAFGQPGQKLVFLFGIPAYREGREDKNLPVNLTVIREGVGEFFGTTGDDKCTIDELRQEAILGLPRRERRYRVVARGFCMQPAPSLSTRGSVLLTRFDFAGRIDLHDD